MAYIDTKYLGKCETCRHHSNSGCNTYCDHGEEYSPSLSKIPTADVVEVVRCKDCDVPHNKWLGCPYLNGLIPPPDFYCAKGTPKERGVRK